MDFNEQQIITALQKLPENKITNEIIIPLLECLGFFKVEFYGGIDEQGKDILCWEYDRFDDLKLTVAQVKHFKFTRTASDKNSFHTVYNQLTQCFSEQLPFSDQSSHLPEKAILISTYEIDTKTLKSRFGNANWVDRITIIDGFKLAKLLLKHKPELVKKVMGLAIDIYSSLEPTLNNEILLKSLGHFESKSIKHIYIDIDFSLGKRTTQLFFNSKLTPAKYIASCEKKYWDYFKENSLIIKKEFGLEFLKNSFEDSEQNYLLSMEEWDKYRAKKEKEIDNKEKKKEDEQMVEPKYQMVINGELLAKLIQKKRNWIEHKSNMYNINGAKKDDLREYILKCKSIIDSASIIFDKKNHYLYSLLSKGSNQFRCDLDSTRLKLPIEQLFDTELNFTVLGDAGAGKTTCLQMYTINNKTNKQRIFIFLPLSRVVRFESHDESSKNIKSNCKRLVDKIVNYLLSSSVSISNEQFETLLKTNKVTLLFDGLDEAIKKAPWLIKEIIHLSELYSKNVQVIVTSRTSGDYVNEIPFFTVTLLPFTNEQKKYFIERWFQYTEKNIAVKIKKHLNRNTSLSELVNNPLLTTILCVLAESQLPLPNTEVNLYNDRIDLLTGYYDNVKNISRTITQPDILKNLSRKLAFYLHSNVKREEDLIELEKISIRLLQNTVRQEVARNALNELIDPCNILVPMTDDGKFGFGHLRFQEHLAAKEIISNRGVKISPLLNQTWWKSVLKFFSTMNDDLVWFIHMLGKQNEITSKRSEILHIMIDARPANERKNLMIILNQYLKLDGWDEIDDNI